jgi:hypothetical protein
MTDHYVTADPAAWASARDELRAATAAQNALTAAARKTHGDEVSRRLVRAQEALLDLYAPDVQAVIEKLEIIWEIELGEDDQESGWKQIVIGDLRRIQRLQGC